MLNRVLMMLSRAKFFVQTLSNKDSIKIFSKPLDKAENMVYNIYRLNFRITDRRYTMIYGYARVSTANQKLERQTENIRRDYPDVTLMTEKPGAGEQKTVPVVGFTLRAREAEELTT